MQFALIRLAAVACAIGTASSQGLSQNMTGLGDFPGGYFSSSAKAISADGSVIVGVSESDKGNESFRWTKEGGMVGLGDLPGGRFYSAAHDVSADGSVIVGLSGTDEGMEAFRWEK